MPRLTQDHAAAAAARSERFQQRVDDINRNERIHPSLRAPLLAKTYLAHKADMTQMQADWQRQGELTAAELRKQLFGASQVTGADAVSFRDAQDRAAQLEDADQAAVLLDRAVQSGDHHLAQAVAERAYANANGLFGNQWAAVLQQYATSRPWAADKFNEYGDALYQGDNFNAAMTFGAPRPTGLSDHLTEGQLQTLAEQVDGSAAVLGAAQ